MRIISRLFPAVLALALSAAAPPDWTALKRGWRQRIEAVRDAGRLPIIDFESCYFEAYMNPAAILPVLEENGVVLSAWSLEEEPGRVNARGYDWWHGRWPGRLRGLAEEHPEGILPVPTVTGVISKPPLKAGWRLALDDILAEAEAGRYPMLGEFAFRRYPSPDDLRLAVKDEETVELDEPIDGAVGRRLFEFSQRTGVPFQIHYEPEDKLIPRLEKMLRRYPRARVVWCHAGRVRRPEQAPRFVARWSQTLRRLLEEHPNLYLDISSVEKEQVYPLNGPPTSLWWDPASKRMKAEGVRLVCDHPWRFLAALDIGRDRGFRAGDIARKAKAFLMALPSPAREIVAYKAAWKLLFNEELP